MKGTRPSIPPIHRSSFTRSRRLPQSLKEPHPLPDIGANSQPHLLSLLDDVPSVLLSPRSKSHLAREHVRLDHTREVVLLDGPLQTMHRRQQRPGKLRRRVLAVWKDVRGEQGLQGAL